jgi:phospholipid/cholesterol/gamma-HCH transport system substrate-binding protein
MAAIAAALAAVAILVVVLTGGDRYEVTAKFVSASQLVKGNEVKVAGEPIGTVKDIELTDDGQAQVKMAITEDGYHPLRRGTRATVRQSSLSGVANRYVDLQLGGQAGAEIPDGGRIGAESTQSAVDLDQLFDTFDPQARAGVKGTVRLLRDFQAGREDEANQALRYFNPALASSSRLFAELNRNTPDFRRFIDETAKLVTDTASRDDDLAGLVSNLARTTDAIAARRGRLGEAIDQLPTFMRSANTTFVNLRASLDDLDPLVADAKPVVGPRLRPLLAQLKPFARDARPAVADLSRTIRRSGRDNDLVELIRRQPAIDAIANRTAQRNGEDRPGALPATQRALDGATPQLAFARPYAPELVGWFDDFSTSGAYDALGSFSRAGLEFNGFTLGPLANLLPVPPALRTALLSAGVKTGRNNRCPGAIERRAVDGSNPYRPTPSFNCDPTQVPVGP